MAICVHCICVLIHICKITNISGGTIRRELDFQTRVHVLISTSIPTGNVGDKKRNHGRRFE